MKTKKEKLYCELSPFDRNKLRLMEEPGMLIKFWKWVKKRKNKNAN